MVGRSVTQIRHPFHAHADLSPMLLRITTEHSKTMKGPIFLLIYVSDGPNIQTLAEVILQLKYLQSCRLQSTRT